MSSFVLPFYRALGADVFAALQSDQALKIAFSGDDDAELPVPRVSARWQAWEMYDGPTPQLLYKADIALPADLPPVRISRIWLLDQSDAVLTMANLPGAVTAGDGVATSIPDGSLLFTLRGGV